MKKGITVGKRICKSVIAMSLTVSMIMPSTLVWAETDVISEESVVTAVETELSETMNLEIVDNTNSGIVVDDITEDSEDKIVDEQTKSDVEETVVDSAEKEVSVTEDITENDKKPVTEDETEVSIVDDENVDSDVEVVDLDETSVTVLKEKEAKDKAALLEEEEEEETVEDLGIELEFATWVNPVYEDLVTDEELEKQVKEEFGETLTEVDDAKSCTTYAQAVEYVRDQMIRRATSVSFTIPTSVNIGSLDSFLDAVMVDTPSTAANAGDYIRYNTKGWGASYGGGSYNFTFKYLTSSFEETMVDSRVDLYLNQIMNISSFSTDYEKVKEIYEFITTNTTYDRSLTKYSAYNALLDQNCVCQGYALAMYRMTKEAGIPIRFIPGKGAGGNHAWNIVRIDGKYYNVDATWEVEGTASKTWFLKSNADFIDHTRDPEVNTASFNTQHPMATKSYASKAISYINIANRNVSFSRVDGGTVTTNSDGKCELIIFGSPTCYYTTSFLKAIAKTPFVGNSKIKVLFADGSSNLSGTQSLKSEYGNSIIWASDSNTYNEQFNYYRAWTGEYGRISVSWPEIIIVDKNNVIKYAACRPDFSEVTEALSEISGVVGETPTLPQPILKDGFEYSTADGKWHLWKSGSDKGPYTGILYDTYNKQNIYCINGSKAVNYTGPLYSVDSWYKVTNGNVLGKFNGIMYDTYNKLWIYTVDGKKATAFTGPVFSVDRWYKITKGNVIGEFNGIMYDTYNKVWIYAVGGKKATTFTGPIFSTDRWYRITKGAVIGEFNGIMYDTYNKVWIYAVNGKKATTFTGPVYSVDRWYRITKGAVIGEYNGIMYDNYNKQSIYCVNGRKAKDFTGQIYSVDRWYNIKAGVNVGAYNGLMYDTYNKVWIYTVNGKRQNSFNGIYNQWCIKNGAIYSFTGLWQDAKTGWWYVENGKVNAAYSDVFYNPQGIGWLVLEGRPRFQYTGWYQSKKYGRKYIKDGKVQ